MKINKIDLLILVIIILFVVVVASSFTAKQVVSEEVVTISVKITQNVEEIEDEVAESIGEEIYMNGLKDPVVLESYSEDAESLVLVLKDTGFVENDFYYFNGQRVLAGQKIELHGKLWSQGVITDINYEAN